MSVIAYFQNIGRRKDSWSQELPLKSERAIVDAIRTRGSLMSRDISVNLAATPALVFAGIRTVGTVSFTDPVN